MPNEIKSPFRSKSPFGGTAYSLRVNYTALAFLASALPYTVNGANKISVSDSKSAGGTYQVALSISSGTTTLSGTTGLTNTAGANGSASMTYTGSVANFNAALDNLVIDTASAGNRTITLTFSHPATGRSVTKVIPVLVGTLAANSVAPVISGAGTIGSTFTATPGVWTGVPAPAVTAQWLRNGTAIPGATSYSYVAQLADDGAALKLRETGLSVFNSVSADSNSIAVGNTLAAPVLAWDGEVADTTPDFTGTLSNPQIGDVVTLELYSDVGLTTLVDSSANTLDAGEVSAEEADFALNALSEGTYYARLLYERTGWTSAYSNTVTVTITTVPAKAVKDRAAAYILDRAAAYIETRV